MEKILTFTKEQKALIFNRFVAPMNGTKEEGMHFIEYCEMLGLNPLLNDIVFQKYETKYGPRVNFVTTRDGLLRIAARDENYIGPPISNVVREGDHFEFLPAEGTVIHKFGEKRGRILGAYAVLYHRKFRPYACWADFSEYFKANASSQNGRSPIWDSYPSSMIQKVAEVFALKRQFPIIGGLTTEEELGMDINLPQQHAEIKEVNQVEIPQHKEPEHKEQERIEVQHQEQQQPQQQNVPQQNVPQNENENESSFEIKGEEVEILAIQRGKTGQGMEFAKILVNKEGKKLTVLAKDEKLNLVKDLKQGQKVKMEIEEINGFHFVKGVGSVA